MDPLCGWCYGSNQTIQDVYDTFRDRVDFRVIPGGLWAGANRRRQSPAMTAYFLKHDRAITERTGTRFGKQYLDLIQNHEVVLDSEVPSRAIVTVQQHWPEKQVSFALGVLRLRYFEGLDLNQEAAYLVLCDQLGIGREAFLLAFQSAEAKALTQQAFETAKHYATSYPTLLLEAKGQRQLLEQGYASLAEIEHAATAFLQRS